MSKHYFHESNPVANTSKEFHRILYCEWCGIAVWDFNRFDISVKELQKQAGDVCKANLAVQLTSPPELLKTNVIKKGV